MKDEGEPVPHAKGVLDTIMYRVGTGDSYTCFDEECGYVCLNGRYTLEDLQRLCAYIEQHGYKDEKW